MHGFANAGYFLTLGFLSVIGSMAFWFRDIISEGRAKNFSFNVVLCNYKLNTAKAIFPLPLPLPLGEKGGGQRR
jgi:hypothetical protein